MSERKAFVPADPVYTLGTCPCFVSDTRRRIRAPCPCWTPCTGPSMPVAPDWHTACANTPAYSCDTVGTAAGLCPYICCCNTWRCHAGATCRHYSHPGRSEERRVGKEWSTRGTRYQ